VFIDAGSAFENDKNNGVAHFLEHMAFKGTQNRTRQALEVEIENIGGTLNAYTSREQTVYYAKVLKRDVPKAVDILSDILLRSNLDPAHIEAERHTILREMEEVNKDTQEVIFDYLHAAAYQGTPLARTILGPPENIKTLKRDDLVKYIQSHYTAPRMVLAGAGAVNHDQLVELGNKAFGSLPSTSPSASSFGAASTLERAPSKFTGSLISERDDTLGLAHIALAIEGVGWSHPDYFTFMVFQTIVGSWDKTIGGGKNLSSRLAEVMATEHLADSVTTFNTCYHDTGLFGTYLVTPGGEHMEDAIYEVFNEYNRVGKNITAEEVERAKNKLKASILMQLDGTTAVAEDIGRQILTNGRRLTPAETFARIDAIKVSDVMRVAKEHCEDVDPAVAAIGTTEELPDYNQIRGWTYWSRW